MHETNNSYYHNEQINYFFQMLVEKSNYFIGIDSSPVTNYTDIIDSYQYDYFHEK